MDGEFVDCDDAQVHVLTHGLHYGTGVFEGVRCYDTEKGPAIFRWEEHLERLYDSTKPYDMEISFEPEELTEATLELLRRQDLNEAYIRPIAFYGYESLGVSPGDCPTNVTIAAWPWGAYLGEEALERRHRRDGVVLAQARFQPVPTNVKTTGLYVNCMLAGEEARRNGYTEAIVLNKEGNVAEGPGENIFIVRDGELYTPGLPRASSTASPATPRSRSPKNGLHRPRGSDYHTRRTEHGRRTVLHRQRRRGHAYPER